MKTFSASLGVLATTAGVLFVASLLESPATAFAELMQQIQDAKMVSFDRMLFTEDHPDGIAIHEFDAADGRRRSEQGGTVTVFRPDRYIAFTLIRGTKTVMYPKRPSAQRVSGPARNFIAELHELQSEANEPDEDLGTERLEGRLVEGFRVTRRNSRYELWIAPDTNELLKLVRHFSYEGRDSTTVYTNFEFSTEIDESLFTVPSGYSEYERSEVPLGEKRTITALRGYTRHSDGQFPDSLTDLQPWLELFGAKETGGFGNRDSNSVMNAIATTIRMLARTAPDDYRYLGRGQSVGNGEEIVFWYRTEQGQLRAIFDDLSARAITEDERPTDD